MERRWKVLLVVSIGVFVSSLDLFIVNIAFPAIQADFHGVSVANLSWVLNAYAIVFAALLVPAGRIADLVGRKRAFLGGLAVFTLASALCAAAPSAGALIAARVLQAAGGAFVIPSSLGLLLPEFPAAQRTVAIAVWGAVGGIAAAAGPPLGGLLVGLSWHWIFVVNIPVGLATIAIGARVLREVRDPDGGRIPDLLGAALLTLGIGALTLTIIKGPAWGWGNDRVIAGFALAAALVAAFLWRSARHPAPVVELSMLRVRSFAMANLASLFFFAAFGAMLLGNVLFLTQVWHESVLNAGLLLAPGPLMAAFAAVPGGKLSERFGQRPVGVAGGLLFALGGAWALWQVDATPDYVTEFLPSMLIGGIGVGLTIPTLSSAAAMSLPPARFATGTAVVIMSRQIGAAIGVAVLVAILGTPSPAEALDAFRNGWLFLVLASAAASAACLGFGRISVAPALAPAPIGEPA